MCGSKAGTLPRGGEVKILVTGATGFFGRAIIQQLVAQGHEVTGAARRPDGRTAALALDVTDINACYSILTLHRFDVVVHAAALAHVRSGLVNAEICHTVNALGASNVAQAAADTGVKHYIFISSVMVYGDFDLPPVVTEMTPLRATGPYGVAKIEGERTALAAAAGGMETSILRMASMYAPSWLFNVRKRVAPPVVGHWMHFALDALTPRYSLCSRRLGVETIVQLVDGKLPPAIYNVADAHIYSQNEIRCAIAQVQGRCPVLPIPLAVPRMAMRIIETALPDGPRRDRSRSRYWKFCERNVYSSAKLVAAGIHAPADLLSLNNIPDV